MSYEEGKPSFCTACPLYHEPGPVFGEGPSDAKIMAVGEAPGEEEARYRRPFIGGSGKVLTVLLIKAGINRKDVFITNAVKCRPPGNRKPSGEEINCCSKILETEIQDVNPNVIAALGDTPLNALTGRDGIYLHRGVPLPGMEGKKVIGTLHPAHVMRDQGAFVYPILDLQRVHAESSFPELRRISTDYVLDGSVEHARGMYHLAKQHGYCGFDLETTNLDPRTSNIICNGLGVIPGKTACYRWHPEMAKVHMEIMLDPTIEKVGQNSESFDIPFLEWKGAHFKGKSFDTLQAHHLIHSDMKKDLGTIMSINTDMEYHKNTAKENLFLYNCKDVDGTIRSYLEQKKELKILDMEDLFYNRVCPVQPILRRMSGKGIKKDVEKAVQWSFVMRREADRKEAALREGLGEPYLDVNSPKQLMKVLYETLKLPVQYTRDKYRGMRPTTNEEAIEKLVAISDNKILNEIVEVRTLRKWASTFIDVETDESDFVHPSFGTAKASNGRLNSWDPNAQNIPFELRRIYVPDTPEHVFFAADWSQIEWRLAVVLSADRTGLELLNSGADNHTAIAAEAFGLPLSSITKDLRHASKFIVYGLGYGRGIDSIVKQLMRDEKAGWKGKDPAECARFVTKFVSRFWARFKDMYNWRERNVRFVEKNQYLKNPFNRRRWWFSRQITEMHNFLPSSTAADMMYELLIKIDADLPAGSSLRLSVHDEVVGVTPKDLVRQTKEVVETHMNQFWPRVVEASANPELVKLYYPQGWHCPADMHIGTNWAESKEGNPELEKELFAA